MPESPTYYHTDQLGSVIATTSDQGLTTSTYRYDAFGNVINQTGSFTSNFQYLSNEVDTSTKTDNFHARSYSAADGRFDSTDPIPAGVGQIGRANSYAYGLDNPLSYTDADGQWSVGGLISGIANAASSVLNPTTGGEIGCAWALGGVCPPPVLRASGAFGNWFVNQLDNSPLAQKIQQGSYQAGCSFGQAVHLNHGCSEGSYLNAPCPGQNSVGIDPAQFTQLPYSFGRSDGGNGGVYTIVAPDGHIVYVGITNNFATRENQHQVPDNNGNPPKLGPGDRLVPIYYVKETYAQRWLEQKLIVIYHLAQRDPEQDPRSRNTNYSINPDRSASSTAKYEQAGQQWLADSN